MGIFSFSCIILVEPFPNLVFPVLNNLATGCWLLAHLEDILTTSTSLKIKLIFDYHYLKILQISIKVEYISNYISSIIGFDPIMWFRIALDSGCASQSFRIFFSYYLGTRSFKTRRSSSVGSKPFPTRLHHYILP